MLAGFCGGATLKSVGPWSLMRGPSLGHSKLHVGEQLFPLIVVTDGVDGADDDLVLDVRVRADRHGGLVAHLFGCLVLDRRDARLQAGVVEIRSALRHRDARTGVVATGRDATAVR